MVSLQWPCKGCQKGGFDEKEERWSREAEPGWLLGGVGLGMRKRNRALEQRKRNLAAQYLGPAMVGVVRVGRNWPGAGCWETRTTTNALASQWGLQRCDDHEKAHEKAVHLPTSVTPDRPVEVPATQLHCSGLHLSTAAISSRHQHRASCSSCMLHPKRAFRNGGLDFFPLLINITTSGTSWPRQPTRIHHDAQVCRRLGVDNRGGWVTSTA